MDIQYQISLFLVVVLFERKRKLDFRLDGKQVFYLVNMTIRCFLKKKNVCTMRHIMTEISSKLHGETVCFLLCNPAVTVNSESPGLT